MPRARAFSGPLLLSLPDDHEWFGGINQTDQVAKFACEGVQRVRNVFSCAWSQPLRTPPTPTMGAQLAAAQSLLIQSGPTFPSAAGLGIRYDEADIVAIAPDVGDVIAYPLNSSRMVRHRQTAERHLNASCAFDA